MKRIKYTGSIFFCTRNKCVRGKRCAVFTLYSEIQESFIHGSTFLEGPKKTKKSLKNSEIPGEVIATSETISTHPPSTSLPFYFRNIQSARSKDCSDNRRFKSFSQWEKLGRSLLI